MHRGCSGKYRPGWRSAVREPRRGRRLGPGRSWLRAARQNRWQSGVGKKVDASPRFPSLISSARLPRPLACDRQHAAAATAPAFWDRAAAKQRLEIGGIEQGWKTRPVWDGGGARDCREEDTRSLPPSLGSTSIARQRQWYWQWQWQWQWQFLRRVVSRGVSDASNKTASRLGKGTGQRKRRILRRLTILRSCVRDNPGLVTGPGLVQNPEPSHMFVSTSLHPQAERRGRGRAGGGEEPFVFGLLFATSYTDKLHERRRKKSVCFSQTRRTATWALLSNPFSHSKIMARHAAIKPAWWVTGTLPGRAPFSCDGEVEP